MAAWRERAASRRQLRTRPPEARSVPMTQSRKDGGKAIRPYTLHQTISLAMAIRRGDWKYLDHRGSGGNNYDRGGYWGMKDYVLLDSAPSAPGHR